MGCPSSLRRGRHLREVVALLLVEVRLERQLREPDHGIHRRADLVAHAREEQAFRGIGGLRLVAGRRQLVRLAAFAVVQPHQARTCAEPPPRREQPGEGQRMADGHGRGEEVAAAQHQQRARAQDAVLAEQQHRGDEVVDDQRRLVDRDERGHRRQLDGGEWRQRAEDPRGDEQHGKRAPALRRTGGLVQQERGAVVGRGGQVVVRDRQQSGRNRLDHSHSLARGRASCRALCPETGAFATDRRVRAYESSSNAPFSTGSRRSRSTAKSTKALTFAAALRPST